MQSGQLSLYYQLQVDLALAPIGHWVLQQACAQLKAWEQDPAIAQLHLSVNLSALQFSQPDFVEQVMHTVHASGCNPRHLKLELTESAIVKNVIDKINALKTCGITFSLDDFGIGQSSLSVLKRLPLADFEAKVQRLFSAAQLASATMKPALFS